MTREWLEKGIKIVETHHTTIIIFFRASAFNNEVAKIEFFKFEFNFNRLQHSAQNAIFLQFPALQKEPRFFSILKSESNFNRKAIQTISKRYLKSEPSCNFGLLSTQKEGVRTRLFGHLHIMTKKKQILSWVCFACV